jgi:hypothetical protein
VSPLTNTLRWSVFSRRTMSSPRSVANQSSGSEEEMPLSKQDKDIGEHIIYAHLLFDDQARASKAVNSLPLRDHDIGAKHTDRISPKQKNVPKPFHVSSPRRGISPARPPVAIVELIRSPRKNITFRRIKPLTIAFRQSPLIRLKPWRGWLVLRART